MGGGESAFKGNFLWGGEVGFPKVEPLLLAQLAGERAVLLAPSRLEARILSIFSVFPSLPRRNQRRSSNCPFATSSVMQLEGPRTS